MFGTHIVAKNGDGKRKTVDTAVVLCTRCSVLFWPIYSSSSRRTAVDVKILILPLVYPSSKTWVNEKRKFHDFVYFIVSRLAFRL